MSITYMKSFDQPSFRNEFPLLNTVVNQTPLVYFDNAATSQKPHCVINKTSEFYQHFNANVHRATHALSASSTQLFEQARYQVQTFIHAKHVEEIIWTKGCTEAINLVAQTWGRTHLTSGDEIVLSQCEHHANIVPWQILAEQTGALIKVLPLDANGVIDVLALDDIISSATKIVCCSHISNVLGRLNPIEKIISVAKKHGAKTLIDGAQSIIHTSIDVQALACDFFVFSAHKMYGPTGVGVLYGRLELLEKMPPYQSGGEMIKTVSFHGSTYNKPPFKFEPGTPNIAGVIAFSAAVNFLQTQHFEQLLHYEQQLIDYCFAAIKTIPLLQLIVQGKPDIPLFSFIIEGHHHQDIATALDGKGIAVRSGHHCAMPLMEYLGLSGCLRISLAPYNTFKEIDYFVESLKNILAEQHNLAEPAVVTNLLANDPLQFNDTLQLNEADMLSIFCKVRSWDERHRQIMLLGKKLPKMAASLRTAEHVIAGCESLAWLHDEKTPQGLYLFSADSDAKVIRGLLVIVLAVYHNKTAAQISTFDIEQYFSQLGLLQHLSPSRGNGLRAMVEKIRSLVNNDLRLSV